MQKLLLTLIVFGFVWCTHAQIEPFHLQTPNGKLFESAEFINAGNKEYALDDIQTIEESKFAPITSENQSVGFTTSHFWVRFALRNTMDVPVVRYLETGRPITDYIELYQIDRDTILHFKSGDRIPFSAKQVPHRSSIFKLNIPAGATQQFYIHYKSDGETLNLPLDLYTPDEFWKSNYKQQTFLGLFYGLLFFAAIIYFFFFTSLGEKTFLYYSAYVFSIALMQGALDGFVFEFIFPEGGFLNDKAVMITALLTNFFLLKYCEYFLQVSKRLPKLHRVFKAIYVLIGLLIFFALISPVTLVYVYPISNLNGLISLVLILLVLGVMVYKKIPIDTYFGIGIFFLVIGLLGFVMNNLSLLPNNFIVLNSAKFGTGFEVIFLSLSMTNLIRRLRLDKEKSQSLALKRSQEVSELKTYFMSNISHELRTPLNAILGLANRNLSSGTSENQTAEHFEIIKNSSLALLGSINDILDYEAIEKETLTLDPAPFSPYKSITAVSNIWESQALEKELKYHLDCNISKDLIVQGDEKRFAQILNNLLSNAVKFTNRGSIYFRASVTITNGNCLFNFHITDTGVGMNADAQSEAFTSFNQMRENDKRQHGGIGLGLTIVKYLTSLFDGNINISSTIHQGTTVSVSLQLPLVSIESRNAAVKSNESVHAQMKASYEVLVVEDNKLNQLVITQLLKLYISSQLNVTIANHGVEALQQLEQIDFDIILMDLQMPQMDGYEATKIIRANENAQDLRSIPIIAVTADALPETKQKVLTVGMDDYITKPVDKDLLFEKINLHLMSFSTPVVSDY